MHNEPTTAEMPAHDELAQHSVTTEKPRSAGLTGPSVRVLHVLAPAPIGGLERVVQALAVGHSRLGHDTHLAVVLDRDEKHPFLRSFAGASVQVHKLVVPPRAYAKERKFLACLYRQIQPSVVHTHGYRPDVIDARVARQLGIPTVTTVHGFTGGGWKNRGYEWLQRLSFRQFDAVVAVARPQIKLLVDSGVAPERIHLIPNACHDLTRPVDRQTARDRLEITSKRFRVGWVGRLSSEKGLDTLLDAIVLLRDLPIELSVIGDGQDRGVLMARASAAGISDRIYWHGAVADAGKLFRAFDAFVLSSRREGTPIVLLEAMDAGTAIVATAVGGVPDVISTKEALLVEADDAAALAKAVRKIYTDPDSAGIRSQMATDRLHSAFGSKQWLLRYEALYRRVQHVSG